MQKAISPYVAIIKRKKKKHNRIDIPECAVHSSLQYAKGKKKREKIPAPPKEKGRKNANLDSKLAIKIVLIDMDYSVLASRCFFLYVGLSYDLIHTQDFNCSRNKSQQSRAAVRDVIRNNFLVP